MMHAVGVVVVYLLLHNYDNARASESYSMNKQSIIGSVSIAYIANW